MKQDVRLKTAWPVMVGALVGVEIMLSAFFLFGPAKASAEAMAALTQTGAAWYRPEYDLPIYLAGCLLTCCLFIVLAWLQRRHLSCPGTTTATSPVQYLVADARGVSLRQTPTDQTSGSVQRRWSGICLAAILFSLHLLVLLAVQRLFVLGDGHLRVLGDGHLRLRAAPFLFVVPLISCCVITFAWYLPSFKCPMVLGPGTATTLPSSPAGSHRWLDLAIPIFIIAVVYIPNCGSLAGECFLADRFHHWDFYAMGPTLAFHHGRALGTDCYTQYGVGWPLLFNALAWPSPISYGHMIQLAVLYGCVYFIGIYVLLVLLFKSRVWAAAGLLVALILQLFYGDDGIALWQCPSSTVLRSPLDVWFFICILFHARTARALWQRLAAALAGAAVLFGTDTGLYLSGTLVAYCIYVQSLPRTDTSFIRRQISVALQCGAIALFVLLPMLWVAGRGTLFQKAFWRGWTESLLTYGGGFGALPIVLVPRTTLLLFALVLLLYLGTIGVTLVKWLHHNNTPENVFLASLSTYGLGTLLLFVGRSHAYNIFHVSVPFSLVAVAALARWCEAGKQSDSLPPKCATKASEQPVERLLPWDKLVPWGAVVAAGMVLLTNWNFLRYPGVLQSCYLSRLLPARPAAVCLLKESGDVSRLPARWQEYAATFEAVVDRLKAAIASGGTVAVLDFADPIFYLAADAAPWYRYSPLFPALINHALVQQCAHQIAECGADVVVIRDHGDDVWQSLHETVIKHYRLDGTVGDFEFWRRNKR